MPFLAFLGKFFTHLFSSAEKAYDKLSDEEKASLKQGSGIIDILNRAVGKKPTEIRAIILAKYPELDEAKLEDGLFKLAHAFNVFPEENNFDDIIVKLQLYLTMHTGKVWDAIVQSAANVLSIVFAPTGTIFAKIGMLMEFVYRKFIKK